MLRVTRSQLHRYGIAVLAVELTLVITLLLDTLIPTKSGPFVLCFTAVMVIAWCGGSGPALLAAALASLAGVYFYMPPAYSLAIAPDDIVQLGLFMIEGVVIISLIGALQYAKRRAEISAAQLRASEERYHRIINITYEGIWTINAEARTNYVNQRMSEMLGYTVEEMLVGANPELERNEERLQAKVCQLQQQNEQLEEASRLKSEFLINMSHELRTPLTSIMGFSSVLLQQVFGTLTVKQQEYLSHIHSSGEHLLGLINHLLDLAKIEAGKMELTMEAVDLAELCRDALQMIEVRALAKHQHLSLELPIAVESIAVDRQRVLQILLNYLSNAVKFTPEGGTLTLSTRLSSSLELKTQTVGAIDQSSLSTPSAPFFLVLSVSDTGIGIPLEEQHLLFQTFEQMDGSINRQEAGTGLGLALTRRLAELHGGTVSFTSTPGVGSRFSVWLPL